nr:unnamed protein product [Spirometra erinaceieuropaei]
MLWTIANCSVAASGSLGLIICCLIVNSGLSATTTPKVSVAFSPPPPSPNLESVPKQRQEDRWWEKAQLTSTVKPRNQARTTSPSPIPLQKRTQLSATVNIRGCMRDAFADLARQLDGNSVLSADPRSGILSSNIMSTDI